MLGHFTSVTLLSETQTAADQILFGLRSVDPEHAPLFAPPPPQVKGQLTDEDFLSFLPDVNTSVRVLTSLALLSAPAKNYVPLCRYREPLFSRGAPLGLVQAVQAELRAISDDITRRNAHLAAAAETPDDVTALPYAYLDPERIENSVAI
ncbi:hypothetical protein WMY93_033108 [Mugilogobius chulae]|uniref:Lipoxygenase domain-containing protein n=1 Tax=Mugilogobius chulae TaxID=88201 RepID=A0AAW0MM36_9GOBI